MTRRRRQPISLFNAWTCTGIFVVAGCLLLITLVSIGWFARRPSEQAGFVPADLTIIAPSTSTPTTAPSPTPAETATLVPGQIGIGGYVQITGTEGAGLRLRSAAGQGSDTAFIAEESETFQVKDGPQQADGYTWWYIVAPYDSQRAGWAAADYLAPVASP